MCFNSRARVGRDSFVAKLDGAKQVSIHAPAWGATLRGVEGGVKVRFQFTRPRGARPQVVSEQDAGFTVSIHAPAWGATLRGVEGGVKVRFQFTRPRGARPQPRRACPHAVRFNSRARVGRDAPAHGRRRPREQVSIHAPAWGATEGAVSRVLAALGFNSRARVGRDRRASRCTPFLRFCFNSRARVGRDRFPST